MRARGSSTTFWWRVASSRVAQGDRNALAIGADLDLHVTRVLQEILMYHGLKAALAWSGVAMALPERLRYEPWHAGSAAAGRLTIKG